VALLFLVVGGGGGGWMPWRGAGMRGALWLAAGIKLGLAGAWLGWKGKEGVVMEGGKGDV
jgi:hypothetical protein